MNKAESNEKRANEMAAKKARFILEYPSYGTVGKTCSAIGVVRRTFYDWAEADEEFNAIYQELKADRLDEIITRLLQLIKGEIKMTQQQLLASFFLSKAFDPKTFSEKYQLQHTGKDGGAMKVTSMEIYRNDNAPKSLASAEDVRQTVDISRED